MSTDSVKKNNIKQEFAENPILEKKLVTAQLMVIMLIRKVIHTK